MPRIDFYTIAADCPGDRFQLTCRLVQRAYAEGLRVFVATPDVRAAKTIDDLLWTFRDESFLPHGQVGETDPELTPILIGSDPSAAPGAPSQVLINLGFEVPDDIDRWERLLEPIDQDPQVRDAGRHRFAHYKTLGYPLHHHEVRG